MRRVLPYTLVSRLLGVLLLAAAVLKAHGLAFDPVGRLGIFSAAEFEVAVVELEVFLALWLLWGKRPLGSWLLAMSAFASFAAISFYLGRVGQASCGCFGRLSLSPWYAFGMDLGIVGALIMARPDLKPLCDKPRSTLTNALLPTAYGFGGISVISGLLVGLASITFGSVPAAVAYFRGERLSVQPRLVELPKGVPGERRLAIVQLTNWTDRPIRLIGGTTDCSCTVLSDLPLTIPPKETRAVSVAVLLSRRPGLFTRKADLLVDDEGFQRVSFRLTGRILKPDGSSGDGSGAR